MKIKIFVISTLSIITIFLGMILFLIITESGTSWFIMRILPVISNELSINRTSGSLLTGVTLEDVQFSSKDISVSTKKLSFRWDVAKLLKKEVYIANLSINHMHVKIVDREKPAETKRIKELLFPEITMPIKLNVPHVELHNIKIALANSTILASTGTIALTVVKKEFDMLCNIPLISIHHIKDNTILINNSNMHISGSTDIYNITARALIDAPGYPHSRLTISAQGSRKEIHINHFSAELLNGTIISTGTCAWYPSITWHMNIEGENLNPDICWADWPGSIAFNAHMNGTAGDEAHIDVKKLRFSGMLRGYPMNAQSDFSIHRTAYLKTDTIIKIGSSTITLTGEIGNFNNFSWYINIPELTELLPQSYGVIMSSGIITGSRKKPIIHAHLMSTEAGYADYKIKKITVNSMIDFTNNLSSIITIDSELLNINKFEINSISLQASGKPDNHVISLYIHNLQDSYSMSLNGHLDTDKAWDGTIISAVIESTEFGAWTLDDRADIHIAKTSFSLKNIIFNQNESNLHALCNWDNHTGWNTQVSWTKLPLNMLNPIFQSNLTIEGVITGDLKVTGINTIEALDARISTPSSETVEITPFGLLITEIAVNVQSSSSEHIAIHGNARLGKGLATIKGRILRNAHKKWLTHLTVSGEKLQILNNSDSRVYISPDIFIETNNDHVSIKGTVDIPEAKITVKEIPKDAVSASPEIIVIDESYARQKSQSLTGTRYIALNISLGDNIEFIGYGLTAHLAGRLSLEETAGKPLQALGELRIVQGSYNAYGQKLTITHGRLMFAGLLDNPGIDIKAQRTIEDITVGLIASGRLKSPEIAIFSEPPMSNTDAFSYLLLGRPINQASNKEGSYLMSAAAVLQIKGGEFLSRQIGNRFGLEEVQIQTGGTKQDTQVMIGKSLTPKLYINYGITPFDFANIFRARYQINNKLSLQAESGYSSGIDLQYSLEYETSKAGPQHDLNILEKIPFKK
ncbi:MAG: translocation/assembly module TamB domain-containing protein [bacterium]